MKISGIRNIYATARHDTWELFAPYLDGNPEALVGIFSSECLGDKARTALINSMKALGYGTEACFFVTCHPNEKTTIDAEALRALVEGLDPFCLVTTDKAATQVFAQAYCCPLNSDAPVRIFGRSGVSFTNFSYMLTTEERKQKAWALLKSLSKKKNQGR